jgi:peptide deformylase
MIRLLLTTSLFLAPTHPQLNEKSEEVCPCDIKTDEIQGAIEQMYAVAFAESSDRTKAVMVGLAAPQIGIQKRIILVDVAATGVFKEFINPEILWKSDEMAVWYEECVSTSNICGLVPRHEQILLTAYDRLGNILTEEFSGSTAGVFQHEIDHLDGIRFPDRIADDGVLQSQMDPVQPATR